MRDPPRKVVDFNTDGEDADEDSDGSLIDQLKSHVEYLDAIKAKGSMPSSSSSGFVEKGRCGVTMAGEVSKNPREVFAKHFC